MPSRGLRHILLIQSCRQRCPFIALQRSGIFTNLNVPFSNWETFHNFSHTSNHTEMMGHYQTEPSNSAFLLDKSQCSIKSGRAFNICLVGCNVLHNPMNTAVQVENYFSDTNMSNHKCMCPCVDIIIRVKCQASNSIKSLIAFTNTTNKVNTNQDNPDEALTF